MRRLEATRCGRACTRSVVEASHISRKRAWDDRTEPEPRIPAVGRAHGSCSDTLKCAVSVVNARHASAIHTGRGVATVNASVLTRGAASSGERGYAAADLFWPLHRDLSRFDPIATGTLETKIWRSYYDRQHVALFLELAQTLRTQYHFPWLRS